jgi:predicted negative regulator of RcsB-dependent stress response
MHPISHLWNLHKNEKKISASALKMLKKCIEAESIGDYVPSAEKWVKSKSKSASTLQELLNEAKTFDDWNQDNLERKRVQDEEENTRYKIFVGLFGFAVFLIWFLFI